MRHPLKRNALICKSSGHKHVSGRRELSLASGDVQACKILPPLFTYVLVTDPPVKQGVAEGGDSDMSSLSNGEKGAVNLPQIHEWRTAMSEEI